MFYTVFFGTKRRKQGLQQQQVVTNCDMLLTKQVQCSCCDNIMSHFDIKVLSLFPLLIIFSQNHKDLYCHYLFLSFDSPLSLILSFSSLVPFFLSFQLSYSAFSNLFFLLIPVSLAFFINLFLFIAIFLFSDSFVFLSLSPSHIIP